ncbi:MAG: SIMPL domain-containing protein [Deltaproteobacteria bacterium]|nr:SIMPL domain-containing protein [Deltaproteobacteria bacterium]
MDSSATPSPPFGLLVVSALYEEELAANEADVLVDVQGSSLLTGRAVFQKAREVTKLVEALGECPIPIRGEDISLDSIQAEVTSGILGRSSSATYRLRIRCRDLEGLPDALGVVTEAKNTRLSELEWRYPDTAERQAVWLARGIAMANAKAEAAAAALGTHILGVHRLIEASALPGADSYPQAAPLMEGSLSLRRSRKLELGMELGHKKQVRVSLTVEYRVAVKHLPLSRPEPSGL